MITSMVAPLALNHLVQSRLVSLSASSSVCPSTKIAGVVGDDEENRVVSACAGRANFVGSDRVEAEGDNGESPLSDLVIGGDDDCWRRRRRQPGENAENGRGKQATGTKNGMSRSRRPRDAAKCEGAACPGREERLGGL
mmetsp:Transcript_35188/g.105107  ORF Transcript_35188/g.105107 Transcript_35188/m.105107 type:complete len:139 (+) Transcript_35188:615-1031(+)